MDELRQPSTLFGVANETLEYTVIINENRQEAEYLMVTGPTKIILRPSSTNSNITDTQGQHATHSFLEHHEQSDPVSYISQAIEILARKNPEPSLFHSKNTLTFYGKLVKNEKFEYFEDLFPTTLKCNHTLRKKKNKPLSRPSPRISAENNRRTPATTLEDVLVVFCS